MVKIRLFVFWLLTQLVILNIYMFVCFFKESNKKKINRSVDVWGWVRIEEC